MTRLTYRTADGTAMPAFTGADWIQTMVERLAEYEDACYNGNQEIFTPDAIRGWRDDFDADETW